MKTIKNLFSALALCAIFLISNFALGQSDKVKIEHCVDKITQRHYYMPQRLVMLAKDKEKGMALQPRLVMESDSIKLQSVIIKQYGIGSCQENCKLYFLLENDQVITLKSWNKFNCDGTSYFEIDETTLQLLKTKNIKTIRFENGYKYDSYTHTLSASERSYFVKMLTNYTIVEIECND
jgi:hypothetical protein